MKVLTLLWLLLLSGAAPLCAQFSTLSAPSPSDTLKYRAFRSNILKTQGIKVGNNSLYLWSQQGTGSNPDTNNITGDNGNLHINTYGGYVIVQTTFGSICQDLSGNPCEPQDSIIYDTLAFIDEPIPYHTIINANGSTGRVGIGTLTPSHKLHLHGQARIDTLLTSVTANRLLIADANGVMGSRTFPGTNTQVLLGDGTWGSVPSSNAWNLIGNSGTNATTNFIGTTDSIDWVIRTKNTERMRVLAGGDVGIGTVSPTARAHIVYTGAAPSNSDGVRIQNLQTGGGTGINKRGLSIESSGSWTSTNTGLEITVPNGATQYGTRTIMAGNSSSAKRGAYIQTSGTVGSSTIGMQILVSDTVPSKTGLQVSLTGLPGSSANRAAVFSGGRVGVGTLAPAQDFHVVGTTRISTLASGANGALVKSDANGDLSITNFTGSGSDVLRGDGTWGTVTTAAPACSTGYFIDSKMVLTYKCDTTSFYAGVRAGGAMPVSTSPLSNLYVGHGAGRITTTGGNNTLMGAYAAYNMTSSYQNIVVGYAAANQLTTGTGNTFIGTGTATNMQGSGVHEYNTTLGSGAFGANTNTTDSVIYNTALGANTLFTPNNSKIKYRTAVGAWAWVSENNTIALGQAGHGSGSGSGGDVTVCGYTAMPPTTGLSILGSSFGINRLGVNGNILTPGALYYSSDARIKKNFGEIEGALDKLNQLRPQTFEYDTLAPLTIASRHEKTDSAGNKTEVIVRHSLSKGRQMGFIAQEVEKIIPEAVIPGTDTSIYFMNGTAIIPLLTKALQEEHQLVQQQQEQIQQQAQQLEILTQRLVVLEQGLSKCCGSSEAQSIQKLNISEKSTERVASLEQNAPNPFGKETVIRYYVPTSAMQAMIVVTDVQGRIVGSHTAGTGSGEWKLAASSLAVGNYYYTLIVNGETIATHKMVVMP